VLRVALWKFEAYDCDKNFILLIVIMFIIIIITSSLHTSILTGISLHVLDFSTCSEFKRNNLING